MLKKREIPDPLFSDVHPRTGYQKSPRFSPADGHVHIRTERETAAAPSGESKFDEQMAASSGNGKI